MNTPIGFLFDLDGVLIDSEEQYTRLWHHINQVHPTGVPDFEKIIKGTTLADILHRYFPDPHTRTQVEKMCIDGEQAIVYGYAPGAQQILHTLSQMHIPMCMVTSSDSVKMQHLWHNIPDLKAYFHTIIDGEQVTRSKPHPEGYLKAAQALRLPPNRCVVVEDSLTGIQAGHNAGCLVVGLTCTMGTQALRGKTRILLHNLADMPATRLINLVMKEMDKQP